MSELSEVFSGAKPLTRVEKNGKFLTSTQILPHLCVDKGDILIDILPFRQTT